MLVRVIACQCCLAISLLSKRNADRPLYARLYFKMHKRVRVVYIPKEKHRIHSTLTLHECTAQRSDAKKNPQNSTRDPQAKDMLYRFFYYAISHHHKLILHPLPPKSH
jgi:hypothetical protein